MPQGRRKVPFSQKQKKIQLQAKREKRREFIKSASFDHDHAQNQSCDDVSAAEARSLHSCSGKSVTDLISKFAGLKESRSIKEIHESVSSESSSDESTQIHSDQPGFPGDNTENDGDVDEIKVLPPPSIEVTKLNQQPVRSKSQKQGLSCFSASLIDEKGGYDPNKYRLHFAKESKEEIDSRKLAAQQMNLTMLPKESMELNIDEVFGTEDSSVMEMPKRPKWNYKMDKLQLELNEEQYFRDYLAHFHAQNASKMLEDKLSYFELNLETWRQLWRVLEISDILLLIADIRHPVLHFPPSLYRHITQDLKKPVILLLNKIDLAPPEVCVAWRNYLQDKFPLLEIVLYSTDSKNFSTETEDKNMVKVNTLDVKKVKTGRKKPTRSSYKAPIGLKELLRACEKCCPRKKFDFAAWNYKVAKQLSGGFEYTETSICEVSQALTLGCIGHPNVGKSSVINSIVGRKVVSTSRTPGHTKHFQTYFVTCNIQLCDCPGLVFPSIVDKQQQIFSGLYPIAQVREPYTAVGYVAQRLPLIDMLQLKHPNADESEAWTAWDICEAWAIKRGYRVAKTSRYDVYRAANHLLRLTVEGKICMLTYPPGFFLKRQFWLTHEETVALNNSISKICQLVEEENQAEKSKSVASVYEEYEESGDTKSDRSSNNELHVRSTSKKKNGSSSGVSNKFAQLEFSD